LRALKGAPHTFDTEGLASLLTQLETAQTDTPVPIFDRDIDGVVECGATVPASVRFVLVEGNYLLLTQPGWRDLYPLFDLSIRIDVPEAELRDRLTRRWRDAGLDAAEITRRVEDNDLPNGRVIPREGRPADLVVRD
jgi:pantothenate kinase